MRQLSGSDAFFLYSDKPGQHQHISTIYIYDPSTAPGGKVTFTGILKNVESRLHLARCFRQKLATVPFDLDHPYWIDDPDFDIEYHIRHIALPKPGDWRQFYIQLSRLHSRPLDLSRPPWEVYVIEGLDNPLLDEVLGNMAQDLRDEIDLVKGASHEFDNGVRIGPLVNQAALDKVDVTQVKVKHRPRLLSDNGPAFVSKALKEYLQRYRLTHIRGAPYHPMTQGKIERYHLSMKNVVKLDNYFFPWHLQEAIGNYNHFYNEERYHESLGNVTPADIYHGRAKEIQSRREQIKQKTMRERRRLNRQPSENVLM